MLVDLEFRKDLFDRSPSRILLVGTPTIVPKLLATDQAHSPKQTKGQKGARHISDCIPWHDRSSSFCTFTYSIDVYLNGTVGLWSFCLFESPTQGAGTGRKHWCQYVNLRIAAGIESDCLHFGILKIRWRSTDQTTIDDTHKSYGTIRGLSTF